MSIHFTTDGAQALLNAFDQRIHQTAPTGKIMTWEKSSDGIYYTHKAPAWHKKAWLKPSIFATQLVFNIIKPNNANVSTMIYGYYHGHLIETFLNHFDQSFVYGMASALPSGIDNVGP